MPGNAKLGCFYPQITHLQEIHKEAPNATFVLNRRDYSAWVHSVQKWSVSGLSPMHQRMAQCQPFGPKTSNREDLIEWHKEQVQRIRKFVRDHPSHALIEVDVEHPASANRMATAFGTSSKNWGHSNRGTQTGRTKK